MRWLRFWPVLVRSVAAGRFEYADGSRSERLKRRFIWDSLRPTPIHHVRMWLLHREQLGVNLDCGCRQWRSTGKTEVWCLDHCLESLKRSAR